MFSRQLPSTHLNCIFLFKELTMYWKANPLLIVGLAAACIPMVAQAKIYVSVHEAQALLFPNKTLSKNPILITEDLQEKLRTASSIRHPFQGDRI